MNGDLRRNRVSERWWGCASLGPPYFFVCPCASVAILFAVGCGRASGPARYDLSGAITYDGRPVPAGYIVFAPDMAKGNDGPGANAEIRNGVYQTRPGQGTVGGPHVATVSGFDGKKVQDSPLANPMGKPLFHDMQIAVDIPKQPSTHDFVIPKGKE